MTMRDQFGVIPANAQMIAKTQVEALDTTDAPVGGLEANGWEELGPDNIGGRVRAILPHPTVAGTTFCGSVSGGTWKTTNNGSSWALVDDLMANLAITCLVYQPGSTSVMFACTGEGYGNSDAIRGAGIFKSTDGGATWTPTRATTSSSPVASICGAAPTAMLCSTSSRVA